MIGQQSKKIMTSAVCKKCGSSFEYVKHHNARLYCTDTCKKRMKVVQEQDRLARLGLRSPPRKRYLIPYAGKPGVRFD